MLVKHSSSVILHQLAAGEAKSPENMLALVARMRAQMALDLAQDAPRAPENDIEAAENIVDKKV